MTNETVTKVESLNVPMIAQLAHSSAPSQRIFEDLAARQKHLWRSINVVSYAAKLGIEVDQTLSSFREMEKLGLGSLVIGRDNTVPTQFIPSYNLKSIGVAGIETRITKPPVVIVRPQPEAVISVQQIVEPIHKKRGRPFGSKNKQVSSSKFDRSEYMRKLWAERQATGESGKLMKRVWQSRKANNSNPSASLKSVTKLLVQALKKLQQVA